MGVYGQDWASYQSAQPDTSGLSFAFIKVTEGLGYINPHWVAQCQWAKSQGLVVGLYHYPHMGNSVDAELNFFLATAQSAIEPGVMLCLDWEGYDPANGSVPRPQQVAYKDQFLSALKGRQPHSAVGAYMNADYWNHVDTSGRYGDFLWIATAGRAAGDPGISAPWLFHQYSDNPVDSDFCHLGSIAELRSWALSFAQAPALPQEDIMPSPEEYAAAVLAAPIADAATGKMTTVGTVLTWSDANQKAQAAALGARITALDATVATLATAVAAQHGIDPAALVGQVRQAIADAVGPAIAAATVHVDVAVHDTTKPAS